jgi:hypothetical protein
MTLFLDRVCTAIYAIRGLRLTTDKNIFANKCPDNRWLGWLGATLEDFFRVSGAALLNRCGARASRTIQLVNECLFAPQH